MNTNIKLILALLTLTLCFCCTLDSQYSLPNDEKISTALLGKWVSV